MWVCACVCARGRAGARGCARAGARARARVAVRACVRACGCACAHTGAGVGNDAVAHGLAIARALEFANKRARRRAGAVTRTALPYFRCAMTARALAGGLQWSEAAHRAWAFNPSCRRSCSCSTTCRSRTSWSLLARRGHDAAWWAVPPRACLPLATRLRCLRVAARSGTTHGPNGACRRCRAGQASRRRDVARPLAWDGLCVA